MDSGGGTSQPDGGGSGAQPAPSAAGRSATASGGSGTETSCSSCASAPSSGSSATATAASTTSTARSSTFTPVSPESTAVELDGGEGENTPQTPLDDNESWGDDPSMEEFIQNEQLPHSQHDYAPHASAQSALSPADGHARRATSMQWLNRLIQKYSGTAHGELEFYAAHWNTTLEYYQQHNADDDASSSSGVSDYGSAAVLQSEDDAVRQSHLVDAPATLDPFECEWRSLRPVGIRRCVVLPPPPRRLKAQTMRIGALCQQVANVRTKAAHRVVLSPLGVDMPRTPVQIVQADWRIEIPSASAVRSASAASALGNGDEPTDAIGQMIRCTRRQLFAQADGGTVPYEMHVALTPVWPAGSGVGPLPDVSIQVRPKTSRRRCAANYALLTSEAAEPATPAQWHGGTAAVRTGLECEMTMEHVPLEYILALSDVDTAVAKRRAVAEGAESFTATTSGSRSSQVQPATSAQWHGGTAAVCTVHGAPPQTEARVQLDCAAAVQAEQAGDGSDDDLLSTCAVHCCPSDKLEIVSRERILDLSETDGEGAAQRQSTGGAAVSSSVGKETLQRCDQCRYADCGYAQRMHWRPAGSAGSTASVRAASTKDTMYDIDALGDAYWRRTDAVPPPPQSPTQASNERSSQQSDRMPVVVAHVCPTCSLHSAH